MINDNMTAQEFREELIKRGVRLSDKHFEQVKEEQGMIISLADKGYFDYEGGAKAREYLLHVSTLRILSMREDI